MTSSDAGRVEGRAASPTRASVSPVSHTARSDGVAGRKRRGPAASASPGTLASSMSCMSWPSTVRAVSSVSMSPMRSTLRISAGRYVVASGITSAPMRLAASQATTHSCPYGKYRPTRVPLPMPAASMRRARRRDSSSACAYVMCRSGVTTKSWSGQCATAWCRASPTVGRNGTSGTARHRGRGHRASSAASASASTSRRRSSPGTIARSALPPTSGIRIRKSPSMRRRHDPSPVAVMVDASRCRRPGRPRRRRRSRACRCRSTRRCAGPAPT